MTVFFPVENSSSDENIYPCYQNCHPFIETIAALTGISLSLVSAGREKLCPEFILNDFCNKVYYKNKSTNEIYTQCSAFHDSLFKKAVKTGTFQTQVCPWGFTFFVLPLKSEKGKILFYVMGGGFINKSQSTTIDEKLKNFISSEKDLIELYEKAPVIDEQRFKIIIEKLSSLASIYCKEINREGRELKFSRVVNFISEIACNLCDDINLKDLLTKIVENVSTAFDTEMCSIVLWDEQRKFIETFTYNTQYADELSQDEIEPNKGATGIVAHTGDTFYSYDAHSDSRLDQTVVEKWGVKSLLSVPLKLSKRIIGCMHLASLKNRKMFLKHEVEFAEALASEVSLVVEVVRLYSVSQKKALELVRSRDDLKSYFTKLGTALSTSLNLKQLLKVIVEISVHLTHSQAGSIYLIEDKKLTWYVAVTFKEKDNGSREVETVFHGGNFEEGLAASSSRQLLLDKFPGGSINSYLGIPLQRKGDIKGLLNILDNKDREFTPEEVRMLTVFAEHAALAIDNAKLFQHEKAKAQEATILYEAAKNIGENVQLGEVLKRSTEQLTRVVGVNRCLIFLLDYKKLDLYTAADKGLSDDQKDFFSFFRIPIDEITDELWNTLIQEKPVFLKSAPGGCPAFDRLFKVLPTSSCLLVPLFSKGQLNGLIFLDDSRITHSFAESHVRLVMTLAIQIGAAIQKAMLMEQMEDNLNQLMALHQVSTAVTGTLSLPRVFDLVVGKASQLIHAPAASLLALDESKNQYVIQASVGLLGTMASQDMQQKISTKTAQRKRYLSYYVTSDVDSENQDILDALKDADFGGYVSVPLIARKRVVGILNCFCRRNDTFETQEIQLLRSFANQAAIAVENARLYLIIKNKVRELATVFEVGKSITSTLDLDKVLDEITNSITGVMNADAVSIMSLNEENQLLEIIKTKGLTKTHKGEIIKLGAGIAGIAAKIGRTMVLHDGDNQSSPYKFPPRVKQDGLKTILSVPLKIRGRVIGLINIYKKALYFFTNTESNLVSTLANQAAVALENARLYNEQYNIAQIIQRNLMPQRELSFKDIEVGSVYIPSEKLSGDYFEIINLSEKRFALVISDVSGKGTSAAIYNARAKYIIRSYAMANYPPSVILTLLNHLIEEEASEEKFISLLYVDLDIRAEEIIVSSAGHEPLLIWKDAEKEVILINEPNDIPIGIIDDTAYGEKSYKIQKGDILLLYTDGITEARSREGDFFGIERLIELLASNYHLDPQTLANKIYTTVQKFTRRRITDDFSLLVVKI